MVKEKNLKNLLVKTTSLILKTWYKWPLGNPPSRFSNYFDSLKNMVASRQGLSFLSIHRDFKRLMSKTPTWAYLKTVPGFTDQHVRSLFLIDRPNINYVPNFRNNENISMFSNMQF